MLRAGFSLVNRAIISRRMILALALKDLQSQYGGTVGGKLWAIIQPLSVVLVFWFVFSFGFRVQGPNSIPFLVFFLPGFVAWSFFSQQINQSPYLVLSKDYLLHRIPFPMEILPIVSIVSGILPHLVILLVSWVIILGHGYDLTWKIFLLPFIFAMLSVMTIGLSWLISSINVFFRDVGPGVQIIVNLWFWMTPIVWTVDMLPEPYRIFLDINPFNAVVEGYRYAMIADYAFPARPVLWGSFIIATILFLAIGGGVFRRLKPHFADEI